MTSQNPDTGWQRPEDPAAAGRPPSARLVDPEDDLGTTTYGGDFETTRIPPMGAAPAAPAAAAPGEPAPTLHGMLGDADPLPYVQPPHVQPPVGPAPVEIVAVDAEVKAAGRRGTQDMGLLLLRLALGVVFIAHGLQKAFGWWGGEGLNGFKTELVEAGYQNAGVLTYVGAGVQIAAGVLLVLGLFTPVAAAAALAFLINGSLADIDAQRRDGGLAILGSGSSEYLLVLIAVAAAIILAGPGRYGFDGARGWARRPFVGSMLALLLGVGAGVAAWLFLRGNNPFG